jgi:hypothetical protein
MTKPCRATIAAFVIVIFSVTHLVAENLPADIEARLQTKIHELKGWGSDPRIVAAVKAYNSAPPAGAREMTNDKWKDLTVLDPFVRSFTRNPLAEYLKGKRDNSISEIFVCGKDGGKVAFLEKPTFWTHKGKPKHDLPMNGRVYIGPPGVDESSGQEQFQVGIPVMEGKTPIGSIVIGLKANSFR